jgi:uncharacterized protein (DUF1499 family)
MKIVLYVVLAVVLLYLITFAYLAIKSRTPGEIGLAGGKLRPCPGTPNCVDSEGADSRWQVAPLTFRGDAAQAWQAAKKTIVGMGGRIEKDSDGYLWATFRTKFWRFVDDLELRLDKDRGVIMVRSAARVGKGDFGVNRKRVEKIRTLFNAAQGQ